MTLAERYFKINGRYALNSNELVEMIKKGYCNRGKYYYIKTGRPGSNKKQKV